MKYMMVIVQGENTQKASVTLRQVVNLPKAARIAPGAIFATYV